MLNLPISEASEADIELEAEDAQDPKRDVSGIRDVPSWLYEAELTTVLCEPRRHELKLPNGYVLKLDTADLLAPGKFLHKFLDLVGSFPPFPTKNVTRFYRDLVSYWLEHRQTEDAPPEASNEGSLRADLLSVIQRSSLSERHEDMARGYVVEASGGRHAFNARCMLRRVKGDGHFNLGPSNYYAALRALGAKRQSVRFGDQVTSCWTIDLSSEDPPVAALSSSDAPLDPPAPLDPSDLFSDPDPDLDLL